jgi:hypothetical protein
LAAAAASSARALALAMSARSISSKAAGDTSWPFLAALTMAVAASCDVTAPLHSPILTSTQNEREREREREREGEREREMST